MTAQDIKGQPVWVMAKGYAPDEGGQQTYAQGVAQAYADAGAKVTVFTQTSAGPRRTTIGNCKIVDIGAGKNLAVPIRFLAALKDALKHEQPLFVHGTTWRTSAIPMLLGLHYVTTFHGREFMYANGAALWAMRRIARKAAKIFAVSHYSAGRLTKRLNLAENNIGVAWNGIGLGRNIAVPGTENRVPLLFTLCRLEPRKNVESCLRACATMRDQGHRFRYVVAGRGPELEPLRDLAKELDLSEIVEIAGFVPDDMARDLYGCADIFLHPQVSADHGRDFEGFGIAIADAMMSGCAVIVGREGGAAELVDDGISGLVVDGEDQQAITLALKDLLADSKRRASIAKAGQARAEKLFTWDNHIAIVLGQL